jgi:hypothetical protein
MLCIAKPVVLYQKEKACKDEHAKAKATWMESLYAAQTASAMTTKSHSQVSCWQTA